MDDGALGLGARDPPLIRAMINTLTIGIAAAGIGMFWYALVAYISASGPATGRAPPSIS